MCISFFAPSRLLAVSVDETPALSDSNANFLWSEGQKKFDEGEFESAVYLFDRLVAQYPAFNQAQSTHLYLGRALLEVHRPEEALPHLRSYVEFHSLEKSPSPQSVRARLELARCYLKLEKGNEAILALREVLDPKAHPNASFSLTPEIHLEGRLIEAQSYFKLHQEDLALSSIQKALSQVNENTERSLVAQVFRWQLKLKLRGCKKSLQVFDRNDEVQFLLQTEQQGACLLERFLDFRKIIDTEDLEALELAGYDVREAFQFYAQSIESIPPTAKHQRTAKQFRRFQGELRDRLKDHVKKNTKIAVGFLKEWKKHQKSSVQQLCNKTIYSLKHIKAKKAQLRNI